MVITVMVEEGGEGAIAHATPAMVVGHGTVIVGVLATGDTTNGL